MGHKLKEAYQQLAAWAKRVRQLEAAAKAAKRRKAGKGVAHAK